jgi:uncharacterized protein (TIGR03086 family)
MGGTVSGQSAARYQVVASGFTARALSVAAPDWRLPTPCEGWVAADIVEHLVEWVPAFLHEGSGLAVRPGPSPDGGPARAWLAMSDQVQALLDDPEQAGRAFDHPTVGRHRVDEAVTAFVLPDVLVHTWDLARATGLDEALDEQEVVRLLDRVQPLDDVIRQSGQYGPRVDVSPAADPQTRLLAFLGRRP